jgi:hypothetical protein
VQGAGCRVQGAGCRVQGLDFRVQKIYSEIYGSDFTCTCTLPATGPANTCRWKRVVESVGFRV